MYGRLKMRTRTKTSIASTVMIVGLLSAPGHAAVRQQFDVGYDPDDRPADGWVDPDIRSSTRKVSLDDDGRRWLAIRFTTYDVLQIYWTVVVRLDIRGDQRTDAKLAMTDDGAGTWGCRFKPKLDAPWRDGRFHFVGRLLLEHGGVCRVPMAWVQARKPIRWKIFSPKSVEPGHRVDEYAPDRGWYD